MSSRAVSISTGVVLPELRSRLHNSTPEKSGNVQSSSTSAKDSCRRRSRASWPLSQPQQWYPADASSSTRNRSSSGSSSTISSLSAGLSTVHQVHPQGRCSVQRGTLHLPLQVRPMPPPSDQTLGYALPLALAASSVLLLSKGRLLVTDWVYSRSYCCSNRFKQCCQNQSPCTKPQPLWTMPRSLPEPFNRPGTKQRTRTGTSSVTDHSVS